MKILIVGFGFVGTATDYLFTVSGGIHCWIHDPMKGFVAEKEQYDYIFLCVPTDLVNGRLDTSILHDAFNEWKDYGQIVIRSTIGPDQVPEFPNAIMMPEFLREKHWRKDVINPNIPIIVSDYVLHGHLNMALPNKTILYLPPQTASFFKLARNSALAMKVAVANELHDICTRRGIIYDDIKDLLATDVAVGGTHWDVPGPDGMMGFGGKCLPKDLTHTEKLCYNTDNVFETALRCNKRRRPFE
jgi:UDP-glucose 6-dehydrogenase